MRIRVARLRQEYELPDKQSWPTRQEIGRLQDETIGEVIKKRMRKLGDGLWVAASGRHVGRSWLPDTERTVEMRSRLSVVAHAASAGHRGVDATLRALRQWITWPGMDKDVRGFVSNCIQCARNRPEALAAAPWGTLVHAKTPGEVLHMDFLLVDGRKGQESKYLLVMKDDLSHWVNLVPVARARAVNVVTAVIKWSSLLGIPQIIVTDQGAHFKNELVKELGRAMRLQHKFTFPYSPWSNGTVERVNKEIIRLLRSFCGEFRVRPERWVDVLPLVQYALNTTKYQSLGGVSPAEIVTGREPRMPLEFVLGRDVGTDHTAISRVNVEQIRRELGGLKGRLEQIHQVVQDERLKKHLKNVSDVG